MSELAEKVKAEYDAKQKRMGELRDELAKLQEEMKPAEAYLRAAGLLNGEPANAGAKGRPTKDSIVAELKSLNVEFDEGADFKTLMARLKEARASQTG